MRKRNLKISTGALCAFAIIYYFLDYKSIAALLAAVTAHELGHIAALKVLGLRITKLKVEVKGFCIDYCGYTGAVGHCLAAAAGPAMGFLYALWASKMGNRLGEDWLCLSAGLSFCLSVFNLIPALPLDGGRILMSLCCCFYGEQRGRLICATVSTVCGLLLLSAGTVCMFKGMGAALLISAIWVLAYQEGVEKRLEIL